MFPKIRVPQNGWFIMDNPINKWMIWGYHYFRNHPYGIHFTFQLNLPKYLKFLNTSPAFFSRTHWVLGQAFLTAAKGGDTSCS